MALEITVNNNYTCQPASGNVPSTGEVKFNCSPANGAKIVTSPHEAFVGESATGNFNIQSGSNNNYSPNTAKHGNTFTIHYCACDPNGPDCNPEGPSATGYTIQVGSQTGAPGSDRK